jgi:hypothetical protein
MRRNTPIGLEIFEKIVLPLRADDFRATEAKPTKASVATFKIKFPELDVTASLLASWRGHRIECRVYTGCITPFWRHVPPTTMTERWVQGCAAIEKILRGDPSVGSLTLLTKEEERSPRLRLSLRTSPLNAPSARMTCHSTLPIL